MAKLGALDLRSVTVDGKATSAHIDGQTIVVPLGGVLPDGAATTVVVRFAARLRSSIAGSNWLFTRANGIVDMHRWIPWISRKRRFERPNHGDPFVTPVSPRVTVRIRTDVPVRYRQHRRPDRHRRRRPDADLPGDQRARLRRHGGHRLPIEDRGPSATRSCA